MSTIHPGGRPYLAEIARLRASLKHIRDVVGGHKQQMIEPGRKLVVPTQLEPVACWSA
jgi:hypothetical protein